MKDSMLAQFFELRYEVRTFKEDENKLDIISVFNEATFEASLTYLGA